MERRSSSNGFDSLFRATAPKEAEERHTDDRPADTGGTNGADGPGGSAGPGGPGSAGGASEAAVAETGRRRLIQPSRSFPAVIRVVGVGGAGTNAVNRMLEAGVEGVEFIAINTDTQALQGTEADHKLRIGRDLTRGLSSGSDPQIGRESALQAYDEIKALLKGSDMVFVTAGEGGGTGTGAAPVVAEIAREVGALTIGVVSRPFGFEGRRRQTVAGDGICELRDKADTVIVVPNDKLLEVVPRGTTMLAAMQVADDVLRQGIQGICDLVTTPGLINLDLADVRTIMSNAGTAHMGIGEARGNDRAKKAAESAVNSSLLETSITGAKGILLNVSGGDDLSLLEVSEVAQTVTEAADPEANIIFGAVVDPALGDMLRVTVVAAGFSTAAKQGGEPLQPDVGEPPLGGEPEAASPEAERSEAERQEARIPTRPSSGAEGDGIELPGFVLPKRNPAGRGEEEE